MPRHTVDPATAAGMLKALTVGHSCGQACTGSVTLGDGTTVDLRCPYAALEMSVAADRRIVATLYAGEAREVLPRC